MNGISDIAGQHPQREELAVAGNKTQWVTHWINAIYLYEASAFPMRRIAGQLSLEKWSSKLKIINLVSLLSFNESISVFESVVEWMV